MKAQSQRHEAIRPKLVYRILLGILAVALAARSRAAIWMTAWYVVAELAPPLFSAHLLVFFVVAPLLCALAWVFHYLVSNEQL
ncbi:hypothetical protein [Aliiroseovarius sp.]|uniref:hypothetical protein n=1 Tax=Aliiroseovarius sp. TaxID=1872442 RepID=UPI003BAC38B5